MFNKEEIQKELLRILEIYKSGRIQFGNDELLNLYRIIGNS